MPSLRPLLAALTLALTLALALSHPAHACSTFAVQRDGQAVFGQNYDWDLGDAAVIVNPRGLRKVAAVDHQNGASWTSQYGSVTFNQYGREFPCGGMNEKGLVVAVMWLNEMELPPADARPSINLLQWIQYQLDTAETVADVLASTDTLRFDHATLGTTTHYLVADRLGNAATVEMIGGRLVVHHGDDLPYAALTNDTYSRSLAKLRSYQSAGPTATIPTDTSSLSRFARCAVSVQRMARQGTGDLVPDAFSTLQAVRSPARTQWTIVYDQTALVVHFHTLENPNRRHIDLASLDFSCDRSAAYVDVNAGSGDITPSFAPLDHATNVQYVENAFRQTPFLSANVPLQAATQMGQYPANFACAPN